MLYRPPHPRQKKDDGRHAVDRDVSAEETRDAEGVQPEVCICEWVGDGGGLKSELDNGSRGGLGRVELLYKLEHRLNDKEVEV